MIIVLQNFFGQTVVTTSKSWFDFKKSKKLAFEGLPYSYSECVPSNVPRIPRMDITSSVKSAPDGGYGWCVCAAAFSVQFVLAGIQNSFGILLIYILDEFGNGKGTSGTRTVYTRNSSVAYR